MPERLSQAQRELLASLDKGSRDGITHRGIARTLERRGLVSCQSRPGQLIADHVWRITDEGRALLHNPKVENHAANA